MAVDERALHVVDGLDGAAVTVGDRHLAACTLEQLGDQAVRLAISSRWEEAVNVNREFLRVFGEETDALNRLGKALSEVGHVTEARQSYGRALEIDPTNTIARKKDGTIWAWGNNSNGQLGDGSTTDRWVPTKVK